MATTWIEVIDGTSNENVPPPGPYYVLRRHLYEVRKLYDDTNGAFLAALIPGANE